MPLRAPEPVASLLLLLPLVLFLFVSAIRSSSYGAEAFAIPTASTVPSRSRPSVSCSRTATTTATAAAAGATDLIGRRRRLLPSLAMSSSASPPSSSVSAAEAVTIANDEESAKTTMGYPESTLRSALLSLTSDPLVCRHMHGHHPETGIMADDHDLSMLQRITAVRILDYKTIMADPTSPSETDLLARSTTFRTEHGPSLNLLNVIQSKSPSMSLAAEFKRASPSKGDIAPDLNAGQQAGAYAEAGASVISVLTETRWFKGTMDDLTEARLSTTGKDGYDRPAILRKDFVVDRYQIAEAAAAGADTVLLIVAVTPADLLEDLIEYSRSAGMEPLVEVHAESELDVALDAGARVIGVNNRNLHTFRMDLGTTDAAAAEMTRRGLAFDHNAIGNGGEENKPEYALCALSGMSTSADVDRYRQAGVGMCLIGESLMRAADPKAAIAGLCLDPEDYASESSTGAAGAYTSGLKLVKVCGVTNAEDALGACRSGANLIGVIFAEKSKRKVTQEQAKEVVDAVRDFGERSGRGKVVHSPVEDMAPLRALSVKARALESAAAKGRPLVVGVFQNQPEEYVREIVEECGLDLVQLHGREGMEAAKVERCGVPAIRVVDVETDGEGGLEKTSAEGLEKLLDSVTSDPVAILLDTAIKGSKEGGGTGVSFDWTLAESVQNRGLPVIVAGGLNPDNVKDCVTRTRPWGIDVASGTEAAPGKKDLSKVQAFVGRAREGAEEASKGF